MGRGAACRAWGQRRFNLGLESVAAAKRAERMRRLGGAEKMGALYGSEASKAGLSLAEAIEAFLFYRTPVLEAIASHLRRRSAALSDLTAAYREATAAIDGVLTALVSPYRDRGAPADG